MNRLKNYIKNHFQKYPDPNCSQNHKGEAKFPLCSEIMEEEEDREDSKPGSMVL